MSKEHPDDKAEVVLFVEKEYLTDFVIFVENYFYSNHKVPSIEVLAQRFQLPTEDVKSVLKLEPVKKALQAKYLYEDYYTNKKSGFTLRQLEVLQILCNQYDRRSLKQKLASCKTTPEQLKRWMSDPLFSQALGKRVDEAFKNDGWRVKQAVIETAIGGDVSAQKLALELMGEYVPQHKITGSITVDSTRTIDLLIEVIHRNISHLPNYNDIMTSIGRDFETVMTGGSLTIEGRSSAPELPQFTDSAESSINQTHTLGPLKPEIVNPPSPATKKVQVGKNTYMDIDI